MEIAIVEMGRVTVAPADHVGLVGPIGWWHPAGEPAGFSPQEIHRASERTRETAFLVGLDLDKDSDGSRRVGVGFGGTISSTANGTPYRLLGILPPAGPETLGDPAFLAAHGVRYPYLSGAMAGGIGSAAVVIAMARVGMMGFFGSAGLGPARTEKAIDEIQSALNGAQLPYGINLIHSPNETGLERAMVDLYLRRGVTRADASAFMQLTPSVVLYAAKGLRRAPDGTIARVNRLFAKLSRPEIAELFLSPAPAALLDVLKSQGLLTAEEADLATRVPLAEDIIVEADSGGHTDNRPLTALFTVVTGLRNTLTKKFGYAANPRIGAAGGLGTPAALAAAFQLGAAFVLTGSVNQASVEAATSEAAKRLLSQADISDIMMAPAADMFELGVKVQVLKRGTMWAVRGQKLYEYYRNYPSWDAIPAADHAKITKEILQDSFENIWAGTKAYFEKRDPREVERAEADPKHKMALVFRWYLGMGSRWAAQGEKTRGLDYQIWCGPAMGAFNRWAKGSWLEPLENRSVAAIARNLIEGAAAIARAQQLRAFGAAVPAEAFDYRPRRFGGDSNET